MLFDVFLKTDFGENKMKKLILILVLFSCLSLTSCSKDSQANSFMKEYAAVSDQIAKKLEDGDTDGAREIFENKKDSLNAKWQKVKTGLPFQYSAETKKRMKTEPEENISEVVEAANNAIKKNPNDEAKIQALVLDLANVFRQ